MNLQTVDVHEMSAARLGECRCRLCGSDVEHTFANLGMSPLCESFLPRDQLDAMHVMEEG